MAIYTKLLVALMLAGIGVGGYYGYTKYQENQEVQKTNNIREKIMNAPHIKGIY
jgi:predicted RNase H-related nuclease YkuK (DUF458 family)